MTERLKNIGKLHGDRVIWLLILFFAMISMAVVYSATSSLAYRHDTTPFRYLIDQAGFYIAGFAVLLVCYRIPMKWYRILSYAAMGLSIILLAVPVAVGQLRSFTLLGIPIHPAEIAKVSTVLYLARIIEASPLSTFKEYALKILLPVGMVCALAMLGSMSATLIIGILTLIILICSGVRRDFILWTIPIAVGAVAVAFTISIVSGGKIFSRFETFGQRIERHFSGDDTEDMSEAELAEYNDKTFQADQAREAIQLGGILGRGPGNSIKRDVLPNAYDDYIYAIIIEEYGLLGGVAVIILYLWFFYRCMKIARACTRKFPVIVVLGLSTLITMQAFLHIFVNIGILPVTGQTLPMISHGGTALIIMNCAFGIILSVNRTIEIKDLKLKTVNEKEETPCSTES
ncbi:MAG TPA: FtsW/RodA/SpoVE family cell cycle protein [Candidatus Coprenecus merdipullorum]|nr:FtsW/RodA/SpoVE family cell cycle protein [Candidatus Coprenecus merdipullorum]